jgi:transcription initiation factor TFIIIB Brf1 subunit/transcription initiation factor TFIIB
MSDRRQINFRAEDEVFQALEEIRKMISPIPTVSDVLRDAVLDYRDKVAKQLKHQSKFK